MMFLGSSLIHRSQSNAAATVRQPYMRVLGISVDTVGPGRSIRLAGYKNFFLLLLKILCVGASWLFISVKDDCHFNLLLLLLIVLSVEYLVRYSWTYSSCANVALQELRLPFLSIKPMWVSPVGETRTLYN
jgi:hypothetical protein